MLQFNPFSLEGKRILVTGASSGIGKAASIIFSKLGASVVLAARNVERLEKAMSELEGEGHSFYVFDLKDIDEIPSLMKQIAHEQGLLSGLFHAAGIETTIGINILKEKHIDSVFSSSIKASLLLTKGICQKNVRSIDQVSVVFMSSVAGLVGTSGRSVYSASKAAINGAVRSLACELASKNIRVNSIAAGAVKTEMLENVSHTLNLENVKKFENRHLLGFGTPEDVAYMAAFLLSDASKWITGTVMTVDGGYCCW